MASSAKPEDSTTSSSSDAEYSSKSDWKINLSSFSKTKIKLETLINDSSRCSELARAYFDSQNTAFSKVPWENSRPEYGINPLQKYFYVQCDRNDKDAMPTLHGLHHVKWTDEGKRFMLELQSIQKKYYETNLYLWGTTSGHCIASYDQMLFYPRKALDAFRMYCDYLDTSKSTSSNKSMSQDVYKKLLRRSKRWLKANQKIWSKIVNHLDIGAIHICDTIEPSNGIVLYSTIISKYGHSHAQCLAAMLRVLTNIRMMKKDDNTGKPETVADYFQRVQRLARDASSFPAMNVPIAEPLVKVFALEGLVKSDPKYSNMVTMAYSNDLVDSISKLTSQMQTVEGLREKNIQAEYAGTNLASADVQTADAGSPSKPTHNNNRGNRGGRGGGRGNGRRNTRGSRSGRNPNDPCWMKGHSGHTNRQCSTQRLNKLKDSGNASPPMQDRSGAKICEFVANKIPCPFRHCIHSHKTRDARVYHAYDDDSDSSTDDHSHRRSRRHKKKHKKKKKRRSHKSKSHHRRSSSSYESTSSESSDFM